MDLQDTFTAVHPSIVAIGSRVALGAPGMPPAFPEILGTGFIVDSRGIVATNKHVAELIPNLPHDPDTGSPAGFALVYSEKHSKEKGTVILNFVEIKYIAFIDTFTPPDDYCGMPMPDLAFLQLDVKDVPSLPLINAPNSLRIGMSVATAGFPMGERPLTDYGYISQVTPFLRRGIVSSVFPFPRPFPHGFTVDIMMQGGGSGSPIFLADSPEIIGILHSGYTGTNITEALPSSVIATALSTCLETIPFDFSDVPTLQELIDRPGADTKLDWQEYPSLTI
jgi:S1-C subfamily serine protease